MTHHPTLDAGEILLALSRRRVHFVLIGAMAAQTHGSPVLTFDVDVCFDLEDDNSERLAAALDDLSATRRDLSEGTALTIDASALRSDGMFALTTRFGDLDLIARPAPALDYRTLSSRAMTVDFLGAQIAVAALDDLIAMKRAAGRPKDRLMLEHLGALREELDRRA